MENPNFSGQLRNPERLYMVVKARNSGVRLTFIPTLSLTLVTLSKLLNLSMYQFFFKMRIIVSTSQVI